MTIQTYNLIWQDIELEVSYEPKAWGGATAHLKIQSIKPARAPLPVTETGYRSHYHPVGMIEENYAGDVIKAVTEWLDEAAKGKDWQRYVERSRQGELF